MSCIVLVDAAINGAVVMTYRCPDDGDVALNPCFVALAPECEGADTSGGDELDCKDGVHLANELVANIDCRFSYRASELFPILASRITSHPTT